MVRKVLRGYKTQFKKKRTITRVPLQGKHWTFSSFPEKTGWQRLSNPLHADTTRHNVEVKKQKKKMFWNSCQTQKKWNTVPWGEVLQMLIALYYSSALYTGPFEVQKPDKAHPLPALLELSSQFPHARWIALQEMASNVTANNLWQNTKMKSATQFQTLARVAQEQLGHLVAPFCRTPQVGCCNHVHPTCSTRPPAECRQSVKHKTRTEECYLYSGLHCIILKCENCANFETGHPRYSWSP